MTSYKTGDDFFDDVPCDPEVYVVFIHSGIVLIVVFRANTCQDKNTVHNQHQEKQKLKKYNIFKILYENVIFV